MSGGDGVSVSNRVMRNAERRFAESGQLLRDWMTACARD